MAKACQKSKIKTEKRGVGTVIPTPLPYYITKVSQVLNFFWS